MSLGGERSQGKPGSPIPFGYGASVGCPPCKFSHPQERLKTRDYTISGVTRDSTGVALAGCTVEIYETTDAQNRLVGDTISDANGNYSINVNGPDTAKAFFAVAYKAGSPDTSGTTINTLQGAEI